MRDPNATRNSLLTAAGNILIREGMHGLTLDAVASGAGVSKGALLHHFRTKEDLIAAICGFQLAQFDEEVERRFRERSGKPGDYTRAYLGAVLETGERSTSLWRIFLAETQSVPAKSRSIRRYDNRWIKRLTEDGLDPMLALVVRFAGEALSLSGAHRNHKAGVYKDVIYALFELTQGPFPQFPLDRSKRRRVKK